MKKARSTTELKNYFPTWSDIRINWQSVGTQYLNTLGASIDDMDIYLERMRKNAFLSTANLDEPDWVYKVELPATFSFTLNTTDGLQPVYSAPTVRGLVNDNTQSGYVDVVLADENSLEEMEHKAIPTRINFEETEDGPDALLHWPATSFPYSGLLTHHLSDGGRLWIETTSGAQYVSINSDGEVDRGQVRISGTTRKGTKETEKLVFPWDMKQSTSKEWEYIDYIEVDNLEDEVSVEIRSANFAWGPYMSFYNLRWADSDVKIDEFWDVGSIDTGTTLDLVGYISDEWENLMLGLSSKTTKDKWELIDIDLSSITAIDMAVQPFQDRAWIVDHSSGLCCFSLEETTVSGVDFLMRRSDGSNVKIEPSFDYYVAGDDISFTPLHIRPISQVSSYRVWYEDPTGTKYGLNQGVQVAFTSDFWQYPTQLSRELEAEITLSSVVRGEYKIALEAVYPNGITHVDRLVIPVKYKQPLSDKIDISPYITGNIEGIDFDSDQQLWIKTSSAYYRFSLHTDLMIVDYEDKIVYFREDYDSVEIT
jgi:hypothetical protein